LNRLVKLLLAIALLCSIESAFAECTNCDNFKDIKTGSIIATDYFISMNGDNKIAVIVLKNLDTNVLIVDCWRVTINGRSHTLIGYTLDPTETIWLVITLDKTIRRGDTITVTDDRGNVVQSIPLPEIAGGDICHASRTNDGSWVTSFCQYQYNTPKC